MSLLDPESLLSAGGLLMLMAIVFVESGLLVGLFLPGDSLLFIAGFLASPAGGQVMPPLIVVILAAFAAAVAGDQVGYSIGRRAGRRFLNRPDGRFFTRDRFERASRFVTAYGRRGVVLARFVPIVRTFAPLAAGIAGMSRPAFTRANVIGAILWAVGLPIVGWWLGSLPLVRDNVEVAAMAIVALSLLPVGREVLGVLRRRAARGGAPA